MDVITFPCPNPSLTHWGRVTHICVGKLTIIGSDKSLSPDRRQAIIWTNAGILLIGPLGTNVSETLIKIHTFSFQKMHLKMSSGKWRPFCLGLNVLILSVKEAPGWIIECFRVIRLHHWVILMWEDEPAVTRKLIGCRHLPTSYEICLLNTLRPGRNNCHFGVLCFEVCLQGPFHNKLSLVRIMTWHQTGDKPLPKPMMAQFTAPCRSFQASMS